MSWGLYGLLIIAPITCSINIRVNNQKTNDKGERPRSIKQR
jgi:hypothetical protein